MNIQKNKSIINKGLAECVGLWLAEGNTKCNDEITFTNNEFTLIKHFHKHLKGLFKWNNPAIRIYVYNPKNNNVSVLIRGIKINQYTDKRATKPYFIWGLASVELMKEWKSIVNFVKERPEYYEDFLRGFLQVKEILRLVVIVIEQLG